MFDKIQNDIKTAMKEKNKDRLGALRYLKSLLLENKVSKKPIAELDVLTSYLKKLKGNIDSFPEGHEQREKGETEHLILSEYAPKPLSESEVIGFIQEIIKESPDMAFGQVMKELSPQIKGRFDGKKATDLVKMKLA